MPDVHQYYLVSEDQLSKIENPPFLSYSDAYDAIVKSKEEVEVKQPLKKITNWTTFHWDKK